jgi:exosortase/archaeosortase family protein
LIGKLSDILSYKQKVINSCRINLARRDVFIWAVTLIFLNYLFVISQSITTFYLVELSTVGVFQYMAWYVIFYLLRSGNTTPAPRWGDFAVMAAFCLLVLLPTSRMIWVAAAGISTYLIIFNYGDRKLRAAGAVLAALAIQEFWGHVLFNLVAFPLLRAETAVVGTMLQATQPGIMWQENIITGPSGFGLVIHTGCSSYHNLSLAMLCWITVSKLHDQSWRSRDLVMGSVVAVTMIFLNLVRLYLMAQNINLYNYWHEGVGAKIFAIGASLTIFSISLYGSRWRGC